MPFVVDINTRETETLDMPLQAINFFSQIKLNLKYDALASTFQFDYLFDANSDVHLEVAGITHYHEAHVYWQPTKGGPKQRILTGLVVSQNFIDAPVPELLSIGGYSKPGLLDDCDIPLSIPLESNGMKLNEIIQRICNAFLLKLKIETNRAFGVVLEPKKVTSSGGNKAEEDKELAAYLAANGIVNEPGRKSKKDLVEGEVEKTTSKTSENAASYIKRLCLAKNIILSHNEYGDVVVNTANTEGAPVLVLDADDSPKQGYQRMNLNVDGQNMFRFYSVVRQADDEGGNESNTTIRNPLSPVAGVPRFKVETQSSGSDITVVQAAENMLSKSLKSFVLTINIVAETASANLILPNNPIHIKNKKLNLFKMTKWFVESVEITQTPESTTQVLTCVLPWVYNYYSKGLDASKPAGPYNVFIEAGKNAPGQ